MNKNDDLAIDMAELTQAIAADADKLAVAIQRIDVERVRAFLLAVRGPDGDKGVTFQTFDDAKQGHEELTQTITGDWSDAVARKLETLNDRGAGIFFLVGSSSDGTAKKAAMVEHHAAFVDSDRGRIRTPKVPPVALTHAKAGDHTYWSTEPLTPEDFEDAQIRLAMCYGTDPAVFNTNRVMRLPGFFHCKDPNNRHLVTCDVAESVAPVPLGKLLRGLPKANYKQKQSFLAWYAAKKVAVPKKAELLPPTWDCDEWRSIEPNFRRWQDIQTNASTLCVASPCPEFDPDTIYRDVPHPNAHHNGRGDLRTLDIVRLFKDAGLYGHDMGGGKHAVKCLQDHLHGVPIGAGQPDTGTVIFVGNGTRGFHCSHAHCQGLSIGSVAKHFGATLVDTLCTAASGHDGHPAWVALNRFRQPSPRDFRNTIALLEFLNCTVRWNEMSSDYELVNAYDRSKHPVDINRERNAAIAAIRAWADRYGLHAAAVEEHLQLPGICKDYHPVKDWIAAKAWDGRDRVRAFLDRLEVAKGDEEQRDLLVVRWMMSAMAILYDDGFVPQGVLVLVAGQNCGKSTWIQKLGPPGTTMIGQTLNPDDKDSVISATSHWITELGELTATLDRASLQAIKNFVTRPEDKLRAAYARTHEKRKRRSVYAASADRPDFLRDPAGDRRWWPVPLTSIARGFWSDDDMQQLWAQVRFIVAQKADHPNFGSCRELGLPSVPLCPDPWRATLTGGELQKLQQWQTPNRLEDPLAQELAEAWKPLFASVDDDTGWRTCTEIWRQLPGRLNKSADKSEVRAIGVLLSGPNAPGGRPWPHKNGKNGRLYRVHTVEGTTRNSMEEQRFQDDVNTIIDLLN